MPLTVGQVAALPDLGLSVRTVGRRPRPEPSAGWRCPSTPTRRRGSRAATCCSRPACRSPATTDQAADYVDATRGGRRRRPGLRRRACRTSRCPPALVAAAEAAGLPLLEVPQPIPFVALSKAVSRLLTDEEYAESAASFESQRRLIRAALAEPGAAGVIPVLAKHVGRLRPPPGPRGQRSWPPIRPRPRSRARRPGRRGRPAARARPAGLGRRRHGRRARRDPADRRQGVRGGLPRGRVAPRHCARPTRPS